MLGKYLKSRSIALGKSENFFTLMENCTPSQFPLQSSQKIKSLKLDLFCEIIFDLNKNQQSITRNLKACIALSDSFNPRFSTCLVFTYQ